MAKVVSILGYKGGIGKTTTTINLAYGLAEKGMKVLLMDNDPQGNLSSIFPTINNDLEESSAKEMKDVFDTKTFNQPDRPKFELAYEALEEVVHKQRCSHDLYHALLYPEDIKDCVHHTEYQNIDIVPSSPQLDKADMELKNEAAVTRIREAIEIVNDYYDYIIIDNQPFQNLLTYNAISACHKKGDVLIIPAKIDRGGMEGIISTVSTIIKRIGADRTIGQADVRFLVTMKNNNRTDQDWVDGLRYTFDNQVFKTTIRYQAKPVVTASMNRQVLLHQESKKSVQANVAKEYQDFVDEFLGLEA